MLYLLYEKTVNGNQEKEPVQMYSFLATETGGFHEQKHAMWGEKSSEIWIRDNQQLIILTLLKFVSVQMLTPLFS